MTIRIFVILAYVVIESTIPHQNLKINHKQHLNQEEFDIAKEVALNAQNDLILKLRKEGVKIPESTILKIKELANRPYQK